MIENLSLGITLIIAATVFVWTVYMLIAEFSAVAYVPSDTMPVINILKELGITRKMSFWDLGSGDGRICRAVATNIHCPSMGFEINPLLVFYSNALNKIHAVNGCKFVWGSLWKIRLTEADIIYCYLSRKAMIRIGLKFINEGAPGSLLVSKAFAPVNLHKFLIKEEIYDNRKYFVYKKY